MSNAMQVRILQFTMQTFIDNVKKNKFSTRNLFSRSCLRKRCYVVKHEMYKIKKEAKASFFCFRATDRDRTGDLQIHKLAL